MIPVPIWLIGVVVILHALVIAGYLLLFTMDQYPRTIRRFPRDDLARMLGHVTLLGMWIVVMWKAYQP